MQGYYRYPALFQDQIVFVSEDDLWLVPAGGGVARRLTTGVGAAGRPVFSPDGQHIAFAGSDEGPTEVYVMPSEGGPSERLTFLGDMVAVVGWREDGIYFTSPAVQCQRLNALWRLAPIGGVPEEIHWGPVNFIHHPDQTSQKCVIQRLGYREYGYWKRYRGGTAGDLWIDREGKGDFNRLIQLKGDLARPLWIRDRVYFSSDHEGIGNLYSCTIDGQDIQRHTHHEDYYVRNQSTDGKRIVYHAGGDIYIFDPATDESHKVKITYNSPRSHRNRKFVKAAKHLQSVALHPKGHYLSTVHRGKIFAYGIHEGPVTQLGVDGAHRYRLARWLSDGRRVVAICDFQEEESFVIYDAETSQEIVHSGVIDIGRVVDMKVSPVQDAVLLINHRMELIHIDLDTWKVQVLDKGHFQQIDGFNWSPDGKWVVYGIDLSIHVMVIRLIELATGHKHDISRPVLKDGQPVFDPEGKYIFFLSQRDFTPTMDSLHFDYSFPAGMRPYLITLQKDLTSPFLPQPKPYEEKTEDKEEESNKDEDKKEKKIKDLQIDLEGIQDRILAFPIEAGQFSHLVALKGKIAYLSWPLVSIEDTHDEDDEHNTEGSLEVFDFESLKTDHLTHGVTNLALSQDGQMMILMFGKRLRVVKSGEKLDDSNDPKKSGWIDLNRVRPAVNPATEWPQIFREAWRLQRDQFWVADMSQVDWQTVYDRYAPLVERVSTRRELSDLIWEMQGELGTSHAYAWGGDLPFPPYWTVGQLAAEYEPAKDTNAFRIKKIIKGDVWDPRASSPLAHPGINLKAGDLIWAVNGRNVKPHQPLEALLVNQARQEVRLTVSSGTDDNKRTVVVKTLPAQCAVRYREWVENNRAYVHEKTNGRIGYLHIPDMSRHGYAEFHRGFLAECDREGLVVDVRFNGGGNVSWLLLEKLARKRLGYDFSRWNGILPYPSDSCTGNMVALTNEYAGSDGDIFSHVFKTLKLGPLIGKRTWGGVIGIWPRHSLVDGGMTSQPEFSCWFENGGWTIENYGVDPDIEVEITPQDYAKGLDPQLDRGIEEVLRILKDKPVKQPSFEGRPNLALPRGLPRY
jgi:tricorn protease